MLILLSLSRASDFKIIRILLFVFFTFFIVGNSYADKIYKVQANDFLSKIVKKNYSVDRDISKEQVMVAILRANPEAFRGGNIHFLKRVDALMLPSTEAVALIPHAEALQTVNKHYTFFKRKKTGNFPPIALKRPTLVKDNTVSTEPPKAEISTLESDSATLEGTTTTTKETEKSTSSVVDIASTSSITDNNLEKQQQTTTIKNEQLQELEKRKEEQDTTLDQLDNKIKTLEKSITNQAIIPQSNTEDTETALQSETISSLDSLADLSSDDAGNDTTEAAEALHPETMSNLDSLADLSSDDAGNDTTETAEALQPETMSNLDSLADLSSEDASNDTTEKTSDSKQPAYLWLLLPIFALLGLLWWKKSKTSDQTDTNIPPPTSLEKKTQAQPQQTQTKKPLHSNIEKPPINNIEGMDDTEGSATNNEKTTVHSNEEESAIKLDMASAYQAMGYPEEAKEMLEEVLREGNSQQKEMAESLLAVL
jgi:pilus assembly protein FimV